MKRALAALILAASAVAFAGQMERPTLAVGERVYTLYPFTVPPSAHQYFGVYTSPEDRDGGTELHLFPNGRFLVVQSVSSGGHELLGAGTHRLDGDHLLLKFERSARPDVPKRFADLHIQYGVSEDANASNTLAAFIIGKEDWHAMLQGEVRARFHVRVREYQDSPQTLERQKRLEWLGR